MRRPGLRVYSIHLPPRYGTRGHDPEALRDGFTLGGFLFSVLWLLAQRLWLRAAVIGGGLLILLALGTLVGLNAAGHTVVVLAAMAWVGFEGRDWLRVGLARRGWREAGIIAAESEDAALRRFSDLSALGAGGRSAAVAAAEGPAPDLQGPASA